MRKSTSLAAFFAIVVASRISAQVDLFPKPWANPALWSADTLWVGASFARTSLHPVTVSLKGNGAGWTGDLFFIDPKTGVEDRLFENHDPVGTTVVLSDRHDIPLGDTLYFVYRVTQPVSGVYPSAASILPKYTGPNIPGQSRYVSTPTNPKYGHRWSVAGRVNDSIVEFGFEDNVEPSGSDYDYDDIVFRTTLSLLNDEVPAHLSFTDKAGTKLADGAYYSPANDSLYLVYTDDYVNGDIRKEVVVKIKNRHGAAASDSESVFVLPLSRDGSAGTWKARLPIEEAGGVPGDGKAQVYWLGEVSAAVKTHNRSGQPDGGTATAALNVAYPDKPESVKVRSCPDTSAGIGFATACVSVRVVDQSFTRGPDTAWAEVRCDLSGDVLARVLLFEQTDGSYVSGNIAKNGGPANPADQALSCKASDNITVTYIDEVYGNKATGLAGWSLNPATSAYMKDSDGDGRGDKVYVVFANPVQAPPATVTPVYWNQLLDDPLHAFKGTPRSISIDQTRLNVVIIDLSNAPFPKGMTGIPAGVLPPILTLPPDKVFGGQTPAIADSMGPIVTKAEIHPFDGKSIDKNAQALNVDTLWVTVSEKIAARTDGMGLVRMGVAIDGHCSDYPGSRPIIPSVRPAADTTGLVYKLLLGGDTGPRPLAGDCIYMDVGGAYVDLSGNLPPIHGEILGGNLPPRHIEFLQGYPPVAGLDPNQPSFTAGNGDTRASGQFTSQEGSHWVVEWIPPADWPAGYVPGVSVYTPEKHAPNDSMKSGQDAATNGGMPGGIGAVQVVSTAEYVAEVSIFDNLGHWVKSFSQAFGYRGELANVKRRAKNGKGLVSFLVWDLKDAQGSRAANGAYIWKIQFRFKTGKQEVRYVRTGLARSLQK
jgi:hypothetical protein